MRMSLSLRKLLSIVLAFAVFAMATPSWANSKYAALVIHAETGDILFNKYIDERRYPASLTKMMTLYLLFEAVDSGKLKLTDKLPVSKHASLQPATRLGLKRGTTITVEKAIEALVIRSANDVASVVAEKLGGTEPKFARLMTAKARKMGMRRTTFRNASGLPDYKQVTTARDMATLSQRLSQDFPAFFPYFSQRSFKWKGRTYSSYNKVALTFQGADGLKTGYTRASGYNLATTATRGEHRLIGIVLGGRSTATRDAHMKTILKNAFGQIKRKPHLVKAIHQARPVPSLKPGVTPVTLAALTTGTTSSTPVPTPNTLALSLPIPTTDQPITLDVNALKMTIASIDDDEDVAAPPAPANEGNANPTSERGYAVQIGAYHNEKQALKRIRDSESTVRSVALIPGREVRISTSGQKSLYRARFTRLTENEAQAACTALKAQASDCMVIRNE